MALSPHDFPGASAAELEAIEDAIAEAEEDAAYGDLQDLYAQHSAQGSAYKREQAREAEDLAEQAGPRGSSESRLQRALGRIARAATCRRMTATAARRTISGPR